MSRSKIITLFGEWWAICVFVGILISIKKTRKVGLYCAVACLIAFCFNNFVIKQIVERTRPIVKYTEFQKICFNAN